MNARALDDLPRVLQPGASAAGLLQVGDDPLQGAWMDEALDVFSPAAQERDHDPPDDFLLLEEVAKARTRIVAGRREKVTQFCRRQVDTLEAHFRALAEMRRACGLPVFALEHGLDASERKTLAEELNASLARGERTSKYWLLWVVYSAEQGYDYDGDEFWETFERRTPRWTQHFYRRSLRTWFGKFHDLFEGFNPTGPWASWFSIIACPITHALLPRDLQLQLARALYTWRHALAKPRVPIRKIAHHAKGREAAITFEAVGAGAIGAAKSLSAS